MKHINLSLIIILLSFSFIGAINWWTQGNEGAVYGNGGNYWLYSSPFTSEFDNTNFTTFSYNFGEDDLRISSLLNDYQSSNYIYYFSDKSLIVKSIYGDTLTTYNTAYEIEEFNFFNYESDGDLEILIRHSNNNFDIVEMDENFLLSKIKSFEIIDYETEKFEVDFENNFIIYVDSFNDDDIKIGVYNLENDELLTYEIDLDETIVSITDIALDTQNNKLVVIYYFGGYDYSMAVFNIDNSLEVELLSENVALEQFSNYYSIRDLHIIKLGNPYNENIIVFKAFDSAGGIVSNSKFIFFNYEMTKLFESVEFGQSGQDTRLRVGDIDLDGENEFCFYSEKTPTGYYCYNSRNDLEYFYLSSNESEFVMANYDNSNNFLEIVFPNGVYEIDLVNETTGEFELSSLNEMDDFSFSDNVEIYPVILLNKAEYVKDLIIADDTLAYIYLSSGTPTVCGDGVCDFGESMVTCPVDCLIQTTYNFTISDVVINPSISAILENGTKFKIDYKVTPSNPNIKYQTQVSISYNDGVNYTSIDGYSNINEKTKTFSFITYLNELTEEGKIKIDVKVYSRNATTFKYYDFIVRNNGISYGDSYYSEKQTQETIKQDNGIYKAFLLISSMMDLSVTILYLLVTVVIMGGVAYGGTKTENFNSIINVLVIGFILLIIGTLTGCLPASIIVTISIIGIIVLALGFKNHLSGSREG